MQLAPRSYLAAGVALVGASAIAVSPMAPAVPAAPSVHMPVALTAAVDNPLTVFEPAFAATQTMISNIIERQTTNPAPIAKQLVENAVAGYQVALSTPPAWQIAKVLADAVIAAQNFGPNLAALGETTSAAGTALSEALSDLGAGLPAGLEAAMAKIAAGDPGGALDGLVLDGMQPIINILIFAVSPEINAVGHLLNIPQPLIDAASEAALGVVIGLAAATVGVGYDLDGQPRAILKQALVGAQDVVNAVTTGDPVKVINALQHGIADFAESVVFQTDATISMGNYIEDTFANAFKQLKPKPFDPPIELPTAKALTAQAPVTIEVSTLKEETPASAPVTNAGNASDAVDGAAPDAVSDSADGAAAPKADAADSAGAGTDASDSDDTTKAATKLSTKASPKAAKGQEKATSAKAVRTQVKSAVKKLTDGLKKDKAGTQKGAQKKSESSSGSDKGSDNK
ncbi:hypothetical protein A5792_18510 [Mycolicibacterium peregrinum]|uniref:PE-PGRS family protein n=1 Tax=Mycolicibacterium peregrinum TaxID=43304 RepID=A0A1A0R8D3_MYCPR|nr:hypothetical protein [Mycolicibacterium peregrinum]OBB30740.1 hypothetical protein A5792_18510 [Mycolicibacterium peregrinum]